MSETQKLSHFDDSGASRMVDVTEKEVSHRTALASAVIVMQPNTLRLIENRELAKGDVLEIARLAGIMGAKKTPDLIPLCHPLAITSAKVDFVIFHPDKLMVSATCKVDGKTGVEMEALTAVSVACLTIYDMCKAIDKGMEITSIRLEEKTGGKSGVYVRHPSTVATET